MRWSEAGYLSRIVLSHAPRQVSVSLIFDVRQNMKNPTKTRWFWFLAGLLLTPSLGFVLRLGSDPDPKQLMPFTSQREERMHEFFFPGDFSYQLRSQATLEDFSAFVRAMKMEAHIVSPGYYQKIEGDLVSEISYSDGWISYKKTQT
jgi:hypothetical protein